MENLQRIAWLNSIGGVNRVPGRIVGTANLPNTGIQGAGSTGPGAVGGDSIEIHIAPEGGNGATTTLNAGSGISPPFVSGRHSEGVLPSGNVIGGLPRGPALSANGGIGVGRGPRGFGNGEFGAAGRTYSNAESSIDSGVGGSGLRGGGSFGLRNGGMSGSSGGNSRISSGIIEADITGNGGSVANGGNSATVSVTNAVATARRRTGRRGSSATVVGLAGVTTTSRGSENGAYGGTGSLSNGGLDAGSSGLGRVDGVISPRGTRNPYAVSVGVGAVGASLFSGRTPGAPGIAGRSSAFSSSVGGVTDGTGRGSISRAGAGSFAARNSLFGEETEGDFGPNLEGNEASGAGETSFDEENALRMRSGSSTGFRG